MRIISGQKKGTILFEPDTKDIRPTTDRAKEALFNIINMDIINSNFLDLFSGSGSVALEAKSRMAKHVVCVDNSLDSAKIIIKNIDKTKLDIKFVNLEVLSFLKNLDEKFDIIFIDPPYKLEDEKVFNIIDLIFKKNILNKSGLLIIEREYKKNQEQIFSKYKNKDIRKYGRVSFVFIRNL